MTARVYDRIATAVWVARVAGEPVRIWLVSDDLIRLAAEMHMPGLRLLGRKYLGLPVQECRPPLVSRVVLSSGRVVEL